MAARYLVWLGAVAYPETKAGSSSHMMACRKLSRKMSEQEESHVGIAQEYGDKTSPGRYNTIKGGHCYSGRIWRSTIMWPHSVTHNRQITKRICGTRTTYMWWWGKSSAKAWKWGQNESVKSSDERETQSCELRFTSLIRGAIVGSTRISLSIETATGAWGQWEDTCLRARS